MGSMFSSPATPRPVTTTPPPRVEDPAVQQAAAEALRRRQQARGYRSTILGGLTQRAQQGPQQTLGS